jgi:hypothetical protein
MEFRRNWTILIIWMEINLHDWVNYSSHCDDFYETENPQTNILVTAFHPGRQQKVEIRSKFNLLL